MIAGWITYGITLVMAGNSLASGLQGVTVPYEVIIGIGISAIAPGGLMGAHAIVDGVEVLGGGGVSGFTDSSVFPSASS